MIENVQSEGIQSIASVELEIVASVKDGSRSPKIPHRFLIPNLSPINPVQRYAPCPFIVYPRSHFISSSDSVPLIVLVLSRPIFRFCPHVRLLPPCSVACLRPITSILYHYQSIYASPLLLTQHYSSSLSMRAADVLSCIRAVLLVVE